MLVLALRSVKRCARVAICRSDLQALQVDIKRQWNRVATAHGVINIMNIELKSSNYRNDSILLGFSDLRRLKTERPLVFERG